MRSVAKYLPVAQAGVPLLFWGEVGCGKSAAVHHWATTRGMVCEVLVGSLSDAGDVLGYGVRVETDNGPRIDFAAPEWMSRLGPTGVLFLDELNRGPRLVRNAMLRLVAERAVHGYRLADTVSIVAACNNNGDIDDLDAAMRSRFCHLDWETDARDWASHERYAQWDVPGILPADWDAHLPLQRELVASFIESRPELLTTPAEAGTRGVAAPRTWSLVSRGLAACERLSLPSGPVVAGLVGEGVAKEFSHWLRAADLPSPAMVLAGRWKPGTSRDRQRAALLSIAPLVVDCESWAAAWQQVERVRQDVAVLVAPEIARRRPPGAAAPRSAAALLEVLT